jgi:UDP-N-acetylmuramoylalanine--D-glutamate ligase
MDLEGKKVLLVGLGILGGGVATAKWLIQNGAELSVTDLKDEGHLKESLNKLKEFQIKYTLGEHKKEDLEGIDMVVLNPDVPFDSPFVEEIKRRNIPIENELTLFTKNLPTKKVIAITGTRGKTTTVNWTGFLMDKILGRTIIAGNSPTEPFLKVLEGIKEDDFVVMEVPSFQLEVVSDTFKPKVSVITNIYRDHINRHYDEENYARIKGNIFRGQDEDDFVILNKENPWTEKFIEGGIKPKTIFVPDEKILPDLPQDFGEHNKQNLNIAMEVLKIFGADISKVQELIPKLPQIKMRQEVIYEDEKLKIINDSAATSPEATVAALSRFSSTSLGTSKKSNPILITGGTDKGLHYEKLGEFLSKNISSERLILLSGSATEKLKKSLKFDKLNELDSLKECLEYALQLSTKEEKTTLVFSPGAKSFEKFKNEFHRGMQFNKLFAKVFECKL